MKYCIDLLSNLQSDLAVRLEIEYKMYNNKTGLVAFCLSLGRPLIASCPLWDESLQDDEGATGGDYVNYAQHGYAPHDSVPAFRATLPKGNRQPGFPECGLGFQGVAPDGIGTQQDFAHFSPEEMQWEQLREQQLALAQGHRVFHPVQEYMPLNGGRQDSTKC